MPWSSTFFYSCPRSPQSAYAPHQSVLVLDKVAPSRLNAAKLDGYSASSAFACLLFPWKPLAWNSTAWKDAQLFDPIQIPVSAYVKPFAALCCQSLHSSPYIRPQLSPSTFCVFPSPAPALLQSHPTSIHLRPNHFSSAPPARPSRRRSYFYSLPPLPSNGIPRKALQPKA